MQLASYIRVSSIEEAAAAAKAEKHPVLFFAGGTDILVKSREEERYKDHAVIDIFGVEELRGVTDCGERLRIGSMTTHTQIVENALIGRYAKILALASATVGSLQIRNHATIGGNIANASPAADTYSALTVLDAQVEIRRGDSILLLPLYDVIAGPYKINLQPGDLITAVSVRKLPEGCVSDFYKLGRRRALAISRMTISTVLSLDADGKGYIFRYDAWRDIPAPAAV